MSSLTETIISALHRIGPVTEDRLRDIITDFDTLSLTDEERLAAVATTIAATACKHHARHKGIYLDAVRTWSLEISADLTPAPPRLRFSADIERISEGADILISGVNSLIELMSSMVVGMQDRLVTELALVSRLLGQHNTDTIALVLGAVERAVKARTFNPGAVVIVPLRDGVGLIGREARLETLEPRGTA